MRLGARHAHFPHALDDDLGGLAPADVLVEPNRLDQLIADGVNRAERGHRFLRNQRDLAAANGPHLLAARVQSDQVDHARRRRARPVTTPGLSPSEQDLATDDPPGLLHDAQNGLDRDALAAAALTDDAQDLAGMDVEADAVHGLGRALVHHEDGFQVTDREDRLAVRIHGGAVSDTGLMHLSGHRPGCSTPGR
jgi:hypothetical protein